MQVGLIGLKYTGKTTVFNAITAADLPTGQGGVEAHRSVGRIPDRRLDRLSAMYRPKKTTFAQVEWVDVPGFEPGAAADGGRQATRFLEHGRKMDALAQVVRCFDGGYGEPDPEGELETLALELAVADLQIVENRLERLAQEKQKTGKVANPMEVDLMEGLRRQLEADRPLRELELGPDDHKLAAGYTLLTLKPLIVVLNHAEGETPAAAIVAAAERAGAAVMVLCATVEAELAELDQEEAQEFLADLGITEPALHRMIHAAYAALDLQSFFTVGEDECRAWTVRRGTRAPAAAGTIHSDMERGFIRAEVVAYDDLIAFGNKSAARDDGKVRVEGKQYVVQDGDLLEIRFNV